MNCELCKKIKNKGFTLIETLIYSALIALIIATVVFSLYQFVTSGEKLSAKTIIEEEANFIFKKLSWGLTGAASVNSPASGATSTVLSVSKDDYFLNPIVFDFNSGNLRIKKGGGNFIALNSQNAPISNLIFKNIPRAGSSPEAVETKFNINNRQYQMTIYLRK